jgi:hypothetical protein
MTVTTNLGYKSSHRAYQNFGTIVGAPSWTFKGRKIVDAAKPGAAAEPGPGEYFNAAQNTDFRSNDAQQQGSGFQYGAQDRFRDEKTRSPGPATYNPRQQGGAAACQRNHNGRGFGGGVKGLDWTKGLDQAHNPGPGAYRPQDEQDSGAVRTGHKMGTPFKAAAPNGVPGPGSYETATCSATAKGCALAKTARPKTPFAEAKICENPLLGPGAYGGGTSTSASTRAYTMGRAAKPLRPNEVPGPGAYDSDYSQFTHRYAYCNKEL